MSTPHATVKTASDLPLRSHDPTQTNGSLHHEPSNRPRPRPRPSKTKKVLITLLLAAIVVAAGIAYWFTLAPKPQRTDLILYTTRYEPMQLTVVERGTLESADNREDPPVTTSPPYEQRADRVRASWSVSRCRAQTCRHHRSMRARDEGERRWITE